MRRTCRGNRHSRTQTLPVSRETGAPAWECWLPKWRLTSILPTASGCARHLVLCLLVAAAGGATAEELRLPFTGRWFVAHAGDTINVNHHMAVRVQWYGVDFAKAGGEPGRALSLPRPTRVQDFFCWDAPVLSPVSGTVAAVVGDLPDQPLGTKDVQRAMNAERGLRRRPVLR